MRNTCILLILFLSLSCSAQDKPKYNWDSLARAYTKDSIKLCGNGAYSMDAPTINGVDIYKSLPKLIDISKFKSDNGWCDYSVEVVINCNGDVQLTPMKYTKYLEKKMNWDANCEDLAYFLYTEIKKVKFDVPKSGKNIYCNIGFHFNGKYLKVMQ